MNMAVRMIKKSWWIDLRFNHMRYRKRSPENSRAGALAYEATLRQKLARGETLDLKDSADDDGITFEKFASRWFDQYVKANNKPSEQYAKEKILRSSLAPFFGAMRLDEVTTERVEQYKAQQVAMGVSNKTINNRLTVLSKCLNCASDWHGVPVPKIKLLKCQTPRTDYLTTGECEMLLDHANGELRTMILLALRTGMRQGEIRGLQWPSIDWESRIVTVRHSLYDAKVALRTLTSPKSNRERHIPLDADVYQLLLQNRKRSGFVFLSPYGEPFTCHRLIDELAKVCRKAKMRKIGWHVLRHTFATSLAMRGVPLPSVQALLGHSTISTTMRYAHVAPSTLRTAIDMLRPKTGVNADFGQPAGNQWQDAVRSARVKIDRQ
jgi:integrase